MHVYHYAPYEPTALKRAHGLATPRARPRSKHAPRRLLVDLYRAVRQGMRVGSRATRSRSWSRCTASTADRLREAGLEHRRLRGWLELGERRTADVGHPRRGSRLQPGRLDATRRLRDWLEKLRRELAQARAGGATTVRAPRRGAGQADRAATRGRRPLRAAPGRRAGRPDGERTPDQQARWLLAQLPRWHRRERRSTLGLLRRMRPLRRGARAR